MGHGSSRPSKPSKPRWRRSPIRAVGTRVRVTFPHAGGAAGVFPFAFTGTIDRVTIDVSGELITDDEAELRVHLALQ